MTESPERQQPPYARIVASIGARISSGELGPGARVPSTREITRDWGVAMATASKALAALRQEGLVEAVRGVGTVVRAAPAPAPEPIRGADDRPEKRGSSGGGKRRGRPETALTREAIVRAAISVVDADGIDDLSMRRVAEDLGVSTMALYRHVTDRTDLVSAMIEAIYQDAELPELSDADWRGALETSMAREWGIFRNHPWVVQLAATTGPLITPAVMATTERMMGVIMAEGCSPDTALETVIVLLSFTDGMAVQALLVEAQGQGVGAGEAGAGGTQWWQRRAPEIARHADQGRFPRVLSVSAPPDIDSIFMMGMERLLDGLTPVITARR